MVFGEIDGNKSERTEKIDETFRKAGIDCELTSKVKNFLWQKMVWICGMGGMTSVTRLPIGRIVSQPETREMFREVMQEVSNVAKGVGVDVGEGYVHSRIDLADHPEKNSTSSMMRDLLDGRKLELDALNGAVVRIGKSTAFPLQ